MPEPENTYPHLRLAREERAVDRRPRRGRGGVVPPDNPQQHGAMLRGNLRAARTATASDVGGYDERRLLKLELAEMVAPEQLEKASGRFEVVSQEDGNLVLAFATEDQLADFEARLASLANTGDVTYRDTIYALRGFDRWTPEDRTGWALARDGFPDEESFIVDAELWPLPNGDEAARQRSAFEAWIRAPGGAILDSVQRPHLTLYRIRCARPLADRLLCHRDVRSVDLPPRVGLEQALVYMPVSQLENTPPPPENAPGIAVLDSGIVAGHPILAPAVGDAQSYLRGAGPADEHGHGTFVAGIALYDDVAECLRNRRFVPELRLFSGRILDHRNRGDTRLIENQVEDAVRYFVEQYDCRIFNLSYGDSNKPYQGRRVSGLAVTLDSLSRELGVLFIVPTGNNNDYWSRRGDPRAEYPRCFNRSNAALIDPAPALNALTVGSLARYERSNRWPRDPGYIAIARADQPSPFTRRGPSVNRAIKPDLVDYGGNAVFDARTDPVSIGATDAGELSACFDFASGRPFVQKTGTSFAAPRIANAAARMFAEFPSASVDLCRALLVAHARVPEACETLFANDRDMLRRVAGYGMADRAALFRSSDACVTLWTEERIRNRRHHFYEIPVPDDFWLPGRRKRELTVALAFRPPVRTTRIDYRAAALGFKLVRANSLDEVARAFDARTDPNHAPKLSEPSNTRSCSIRDRSRGTVQASTWTFTQPSPNMRADSWFVVVTRNDPPWGANLVSEHEPYALVVSLADRETVSPRLYANIQARLRARARIGATS